MNEIRQGVFGATLRRRREELGLSLDDMAASTRIRKTYLQALEEENLQVLPGKAYSIGFLRIYARQLGLSAEPLLAALDGTEQRQEDQSPAGLDYHPRARKKDHPSTGRRLAVLLFLLLLVGAAFAYFRLSERIEHQPLPVAEAPSAVPPPATQPPVTLPPSRPESLPASSAPAPEPVPAELFVLPPEGAVVRMIPVAEGTMKVSLDGQEPREYQLQRDQALNWKVTGSLAVELSAPGLVRVSIDQQDLAVAEYAVYVLKQIPRQERQP